MNAVLTEPICREFEPQVILLEMQHQWMKNNNYLLVDPATHRSVLVDPAWRIDKIERALTETRSTLSGILITHAHFDHIHLAKPLADAYECPIWMSQQEIDASGFHARQLVAIDETSWSVGKLRIEPILTPGHTPGCVCYRVGGHLFTGDVLFAEGCGLCPDLPSAHAMFDSLQMLKKRIGLDTGIFPGHTYVRPPGQKFSEVLGYNIYMQIADRDSFAAYRLRRGQSQSKLLDFR